MNEESIFAAALEKQSPEEREAFLNEACGTDAALRAQVVELLRASDDAGSFLNHPPASAAGTDATIASTRADGDTEKSAVWTGSLPFLDPCDKPDRIGKLDHYEIIEVVGHGGMGAVLRAFDTKLSRVVAVKVMAPELAANPTAVKRFLREARTAASVHHDHVVTIHNVEEAHRPPYLVMQFVDGQTLQQKIEREGALELKQILRIGSQMAAGLAAAHKHGLIHRDVKPANILLENGVERVKITDFGLARAADDLEVTQTGMIAGTPQYMSPEQAKGESIDMRSDLFSLGSVLYTMCTGRPAFRAETTMGVLRRVCDDAQRPIHEVNPEAPLWLEAIVNKLLAKNPADRFQTATEVAELLGQHLAHLQSPSLVPRPATIVVPQPMPPAAPLAPAGKHAAPAHKQQGNASKAAIVIVCLLLSTCVVVLPVAFLLIGIAISVYQALGTGGPIPPQPPLPPNAPLAPLAAPSARPVAPQVIEPVRRIPGWGSSWSPDSRLLVRHHAGRIQEIPTGWLSAMDISDGTSRQIVARGKDPRWSPVAGGPLAYVVQLVKGQANVWVCESDGSNPRRVSDGYFICGWSPDGSRLYDYDFPNNRIRSIDWTQPGAEPTTLVQFESPIGSYPTVSPDGRLVAFGQKSESQSQLIVRDIATGRVVVSLEAISWYGLLMGFSPDSKRLAYGDYGDRQSGLWILDLASGKTTQVLTGFRAMPRWSPDGKWIAVDARDLEQVHVFAARDLDPWPAEGWVQLFNGQDLDGWIRNPDSPGNWSVQDGILAGSGLSEIPSGSGPSTHGMLHTARTDFGDFHLRAEVLLEGDGADGGIFFRWLPQSSNELNLCFDEKLPSQRTGSLVVHKPGTKDSLWTSAPAGLANAGEWMTVEIVARGGQALTKVNGKITASSRELCGNPRGQIVLQHLGPQTVVRFRKIEIKQLTPSAADDPAAQIVARSSRVFTGEMAVGGDQHVFAIAWSPEGESVVTGHFGGPVVVWNLKTGEQVKALAGHSQTVSALAFDSTGKLLATGGEDSVIRLWNTETWEEIGKLEGHTGWINHLSFLKDRESLLSVSWDHQNNEDNTIRIWNVAERSERQKFVEPLGHNTQAALSPDETLLAVANAAIGRVRLWDLKTGAATHDFAGYPTQPVSVAFSRDGTRLAAGYLGTEPAEGDWNDPEHAVVRMWDAKSGALVQEFKGHAGPVMGLEFSPDDRRLLSLACDRHNAAGDFVQSVDHSLRVWDVAGGQELVRFEPQGRVNVARWAPDGAEVCSGTRLWSLPLLAETAPGATVGASSSAAPSPAVAPFDGGAAIAHQAAWAAHLGVPVEHVNSLGMKLRLIPPGEFLMGSTQEEIDRLVRGLEQGGAADFDKFVAQFSGPQHKVRITRPFYLGAHEVTVGQFRQFVEATNHIGTMEQLGIKRFKWADSAGEPNADQRAVIGVSWDDARAFCQWLSAKESIAYDLPSEAQWEYACRAGTTTAWSFGDEAGGLAAHAVFGSDSFWPAEVVGSKAANPFGLFDMHGNADEWCLDWHEAGFYSQSPVDDPVCTTNPQDKNSGRVARGGTSHSAAWWTRSTTRPWDFPATPNNPKGFRVVVMGDLSQLNSAAAVAQSEPAPQEAAPGEFAEVAWGQIRDGWQVGIVCRIAKPRVDAGGAIGFELKVRNTTDAAKTIEVEQPSDWDLWYSGGSELHVRIFGRDKQMLTLAPLEEKKVEVPEPQIKTGALSRDTYKVRFTTPLGDESQQPPAGVLGFELDGPQITTRAEPTEIHKSVYDNIAWGEPVLGFRLGVRPTEVEAGNHPGLEFFLWNATDQSRGTHYLEHHALDWQLVLRDADGKEYRSVPILTGPKVQTPASLGADGILSLGVAKLDRQWTTSGSPTKLPAGAYQASTDFDCQPHGDGKLHLRLTSGPASLEIKPTE